MDRNKAKAYWRRFTITGKVNGQQMQVMDFNNFVNAITEWEISSRVELPVMQKTADGLLPCPFCGGEAGIGTTYISDKRTRELNNRDNGFFINCKICGANNNCLHLGYATEEIAKHYWNTRK